ncbi:acetyl-CoA acetyltransferase [Xanthobacter autotrophicus]|uniref:acetyl-CoA acetyltransferase n=1 Tax=Xanthobacter TaxID=279 RepID=UPI0024AB9A69|nr:acetyl-CoA acetyltransferase [Xanthobacter autotrophicus]MDI4663501.1 acetyl-CoA acetyltransferase [Xanthobacter autotrophicus]
MRSNIGVSIVGWAHSPFGRLADMDLEALIATVCHEAIDHSGFEAERVDGVWLGNLNGGFVPEIFCSSLPINAEPGLRWKPATRLENACASGAAAIYAACDAIEAGRARIALVVGAEKMTAVSGDEVTRILGSASYVKEEAALGKTFPSIFGEIASGYFERYGDHSATLAQIAAKNHANGVSNPWAQMRKALDFEFCNTVSEKNPLIAGPLRKTDCSLVSDGAAALILAAADVLPDARQAVRIRARAQVNDFLPLSRRDAVTFEGPRRAWQGALRDAGCRIGDLSFAEIHDCFTIAELLTYEAMGLAPEGKGADALAEGTVRRGGRLPVNVSGGLKAKGHPIGATGVSMHAICAMQLTGIAGDMQVPGAELAGVFNMGGAAVANYVSILERVK